MLTRFFRLPLSVSSQLRTNFVHYLFDISWWGVYSATIVPFASVFALRVGASAEQVGLMSAAPAAAALLLSLPAGRWMRNADPRKSTAIGAFIQRSLFLFYALIPALIPPQGQVTALIALTIAIGIPGAFLGITFNQLFIEAVPAEWRGPLVGTRIALFSILTFLFTVLAGQILTWLVFPAGYQVIFLIGFVGGIMTSFHLSKVVPIPDPSPLPDATIQPAQSSSGPLGQVDSAGRRYLRIISILFVLNLINSMVAPLVPVFAVNHLGLSDATIGLGTALNTFLVFLVSLRIARITRRTGNQRATAVGAFLLILHSLTLALASDVSLYLISMVLNGAANGILLTSQFNYNLENVPASRRTTWLAVNVLLGNGAVLVGSLLGPVMAGAVGGTEALLSLSVLRLLAGLLILKLGR